MSTQSLEPQELAAFICGELDVLMKPHGFQAGQSGIGKDVGVIYCIPHREFRRKFPRLAPAAEYSDDGACTDLNIYCSIGPEARLYDIRFEGFSLEELLADEGTDFIGAAETIAKLPAPDGVIRLRTVLGDLFALHRAA